jgi:hypothetical protein
MNERSFAIAFVFELRRVYVVRDMSLNVCAATGHSSRCIREGMARETLAWFAFKLLGTPRAFTRELQEGGAERSPRSASTGQNKPTGVRTAMGVLVRLNPTRARLNGSALASPLV